MLPSTEHFDHHRPDLSEGAAEHRRRRPRRLRWVVLLIALVAGLAPVGFASPASAANGNLSLRFEDTGGSLVSGACYDVWTLIGGDYGTHVISTCNTSGTTTLSVPAGEVAVTEISPPSVDDQTSTAHFYLVADEVRVTVAGSSTTSATLTHPVGAAIDVSAKLPDGTDAGGTCFVAKIRVNGQIGGNACASGASARLIVPANTLLNVYQTDGPDGYGMAPGKPVDALPSDSHVSLVMQMTAGAGITVKQTDADGAVITGGCYSLTWHTPSGDDTAAANACDDDDPAGADGSVVFTGVSEGSYSLEETEAPDGYLVSTDSSTFSVGAGSSITLTRAHVALPNVHIVTVDTSGTKIKGSCFIVRWADDDEAYAFEGCDGDDGADDGVLTISTLLPDDYLVVHSSTPGYPRHDTDEPFTLADTDVTVTITLGDYEAPANTELPSISGDVAVGSPLVGSNGTWTGSEPLHFAINWQQCDAGGANCADIADSANDTFTPSAAQVGSTFRFVVSAWNTVGSIEAVSAPTAVLGAAAPTNTALPAITGNVIVNTQLSASTGTWTGDPTSFAYQWLRCDAAGDSCAPIDGATSGKYTLTSTDAGKRFRVDVTATNSTGSTAARSAATAALQLRIPESIQPPTISRVLGLLVGDQGWWRSTAGTATFAYQWMLCDAAGNGCTPIANATAQTYTPGNANVNKTLRFLVTATNVEGSAQAMSAPYALGPVSTSAPTISGNLRIGQRITATTGGWTSSSGYTQTSYTWYRCDGQGNNCYAAYGYAVANNYYTIQASDLGSTFRVSVFRRNAEGGTDSAKSEATSPVVKVLPVNTGAPTITGNARLGQRLTASRGTWQSDTPITDYAYTWERCNAQGEQCYALYGYAIANNYYVVQTADVGSTIRVIVSAKNSDGYADSQRSAATAVVELHKPTPTSTPVLSGNARVGQRLTVTRGTWQSDTPITDYAYTWERCNAQGEQCYALYGYAIANNYYVIQGADVGSTIRVIVSAKNTDGYADSPRTNATAVINLYPPVNTGAPVLSGRARLGQRLTVTRGSWQSDTPITDYAYTWERCDAQGEQCYALYGYAIANNYYVIQQEDVGHTIRVIVSAKNSDGYADSPRSNATPVINVYPPVSTSAPSLAGSARVGQRLSASRGTWSSDIAITEYAYLWLRCNAQGQNCYALYGYYVSASTYTLRAEDAGSTIRVRVFARNADGTTESSNSAATAVVS